MTEIPVLVLLIGGALALLAAVLLWKVLVTAGAIALLQWVLITSADDHATQFIALAVPALLAAFAVSRLMPATSHRRLAPTGTRHGHKEAQR